MIISHQTETSAKSTKDKREEDTIYNEIETRWRRHILREENRGLANETAKEEEQQTMCWMERTIDKRRVHIYI